MPQLRNDASQIEKDKKRKNALCNARDVAVIRDDLHREEGNCSTDVTVRRTRRVPLPTDLR